MKEVRFFYDPTLGGELPQEEAQHAVRVLRMTEGDEIHLMDGRGAFHRAVITLAANHHCQYRILESNAQVPAWHGHLHLAMAPTKLNDRVEWLAEKATEIGLDELSFLNCQFSERRIIKTERIDKIVVSAMKQSHKAWKPQLNEMICFEEFIGKDYPGGRYICHCYEMADVVDDADIQRLQKKYGNAKPHLLDVMNGDEDALVLIGPEGDFSVEEVKLAMSMGFVSVSLGRSRLRTETAALVAVDMMQWKHRID